MTDFSKIDELDNRADLVEHLIRNQPLCDAESMLSWERSRTVFKLLDQKGYYIGMADFSTDVPLTQVEAEAEIKRLDELNALPLAGDDAEVLWVMAEPSGHPMLTAVRVVYFSTYPGNE